MGAEVEIVKPAVEVFRLWFMMKAIPIIVMIDLAAGIFFFLFGGFRERGKKAYIIAGILLIVGHFIMMIILNMPFNWQYV